MNYSWISIWLSAQALADRSWIVIQLVGIVRHLLDGIRAAQKGRAAALVELEAMRVEKDERAARCRQIAKECAELNEARLAGIHALATEKDRTARRAAEIAQMRVFARRDDVDLADIRARNVRLATERNAARSDLARALRALSHPIACSCPDCLWASEAAGGKAIGEPADELRAAAAARIVALTERAETAERQTEQAIRHGAEAVKGWTKTVKDLDAANAALIGARAVVRGSLLSPQATVEAEVKAFTRYFGEPPTKAERRAIAEHLRAQAEEMEREEPAVVSDGGST